MSDRLVRSADLAAFKGEAARAPTLLELNTRFRRWARSVGFTAYAVGFVPGQAGRGDPFLLLDWPRAWLELYAREGYANDDAVIARAAVSTQPFTWAELQAAQPGASARIFAAAREFGWTDGLLVPIQAGETPDAARIGVASFASAEPIGPNVVRRAEIVEASVLAFRRAVVLAERQRAVALTPRESEVMTLVASGHGDRAIGLMLGVSTATAHFHVEQAKRKLGVTSRAQAVAVAVAEGLLR